MSVFYPQCFATLKVVFDGFGGPDGAPVVLNVRPRSASVHMNGYKEADTFEVEFDAAAFPFSPELVRSVAVELYLFQTASLTDKVDSYLDDFNNLSCVGLVDDASYHASADGRTFRVSGRDYTALMLDRQWDPQRKVLPGKSLAETVQGLVDEASGAETHGRILTVKVVGTDADPDLAPEDEKNNALLTAGKYSIHTTKKGVTKLRVPSTGQGHVHTNKKGIPVKAGSNYWDVIYRLCIRHGFIVFVRGTEVIIAKPQNLTAATVDRLRCVAYGRDLSSLDVTRKMGKETVPQIKCISYDPVKLTPISALYKGPNGKAGERTTGIGTKKNEVREVVVDGITDPGQLMECAETYYNALARSEASFKFSTHDLQDLYGNDLIWLRPGDPVQIGFDELKPEDFRDLSEQERLDKLLALGYEERVASLISTEYSKINQFRQPVYTKTVDITFDTESGIQIDVEAVNFISPGRDDGADPITFKPEVITRGGG
jgi:hypothetical protein